MRWDGPIIVSWFDPTRQVGCPTRRVAAGLDRDLSDLLGESTNGTWRVGAGKRNPKSRVLRSI